MSSPKSLQLPGIKFAGLATAAALALSGCTASTTTEAAGTASVSPDEATVARVIDGDTFVAATSGGEKTVRLLNVDTPETKDPNAPVECMGPEATLALENLLPVGAKVRLELDQEPLDKYGRTLAGVIDSSGRLVNAEIARLGLGVPVLFEPNRKFYQPVVDAFEESRKAKAGLNSTDIACLPAQKVEEAAKAVETLVAGPVASTSAVLDRDRAGLVTALAAVAALRAAARDGKNVHWAAYDPSKVNALMSRLDAANATGSARKTAIAAKAKTISDAAAAKHAAAKRRAAETKRQAIEAKRRASEAAAAAAAEAERLRNLAPVPAPYVPPAYVPPVYVPPAPPAPAPNPYPGYTGPRCYAPGGQSWTPCG